MTIQRKIKHFSKALFFVATCIYGAERINTYPVSKVKLVYDKEHPDHPDLSECEAVSITCFESTIGYVMTDSPSFPVATLTLADIQKSESPLRFSKGVLEQMCQSLVKYFESNNIHLAYVQVAPGQIDSKGKDLRKNTDLALVVSTPFAVSSSIDVKDQSESYRVKQENRINKNLPATLPDRSTGYPGSLINSTALNNYLHALNRHADKVVTLEIGSPAVPGEVALDFVITQDRPWHFYFNANNNVPELLDTWQESIGFIHTQLTNNDDILRIDYSTDSFDSFYSVTGSYDAPWFQSLYTRWKLFANVNRFTSAEFGIQDNIFTGVQGIGRGEMVTTVYQNGRFFLDFFANLEYRHIRNNESHTEPGATKNFLLPAIGLSAIRTKGESKVLANVTLASSFSNWIWDLNRNLANLGRVNPSVNWAILEASLYSSFYLEPLLRDCYQHLANEIVVTMQFQNSFNKRLIPELQGILGGLYTVRGYPQSTAAGDNLYFGSAEYRLHIPYLFRNDPSACKSLFGKQLRTAAPSPKGFADWDLIVRPFLDIGATTFNQKVIGEHNFVLVGTGVGADLVLWYNLFLRADWGVALNQANGVPDGHQQFYFSGTVVY